MARVPAAFPVSPSIPPAFSLGLCLRAALHGLEQPAALWEWCCSHLNYSSSGFQNEEPLFNAQARLLGDGHVWVAAGFEG